MMAETDALLEQLRALNAEIEDLEQKAAAASQEDRQTLEHRVRQLVERRVALEEEINQTSGASR